MTGSVAFGGVALAQDDPAGISYMTFAGYDEPMFHGDYLETYGGSPSITYFSDEQEGIAKVRGGFNIDVVHVCTDNLQFWRGYDLIEPLDISKLENWDSVLPSLQDMPGVQEDGNLWMIPWDWGFTSVIYRTDIVSFEEQSFSVLLDPAYAGRVSIQDSIVDVGPTVALMAGASDPFHLEEDEYDDWRATMQQLHQQSRFYWSDPTTLHQAMASGEIVVALGWPDTVAGMQEDGVPVDIMTEPKEGLLTWVCGLALLKNGEGSSDQAYDFINAMTTASSGQALIEEFYLANANAESYADVDPEHLAALKLDNLEAKLSGARFFEPVDPDTSRRLITMFEDVKAGL
ncbi:MAG: extracellular solute-binding protein [Alphaproteobacteria bacterium]|jgi:putative spermidine/putrescine transport system substrate-binding protein/spermidine/putrescine transport system substrate-binding protein